MGGEGRGAQGMSTSDRKRWNLLRKMTNHVLKKSFQEKGPRSTHMALGHRQKQRPGPTALPAILITHDECSEKTLPTSKLTAISESEAGFLFPFRSALRLNNSNMNEIMTVLVSAV